MAKQLNVNLGFTADTSQAKAQLQDLQRQLTNLTKMTGVSSKDFSFTDEIYKATEAAAQLKVQIEQATNVNTGKLDLSKFNDSLQKSGVKLADYRDILMSFGPQGEKAFATLVTSVQNADVPIKRVNARLQEMKTTLANTARWQLSSSLLHGFMGAVQSAYGYVQDLNESLNNIRIVTGYGSDEMAIFADQANKAAKALSTTTVEYTDAALIYYQQGLTAEEVQKRTDITVKMANVARQSAEVVSDQMTAVWNNFYDGTKSLEYYADVMTALGAKTASSTDEIAGGLEKFAAVGDTIGLSFDYAAAALATITSNTRQTEDVVGTALKTIFARIQGLNLGETLDDGTTLNKYSEALEKVGINIFDQAGELKTMDSLLDELGNKWDTLNKAQQTALAQTVAGVRQYTQLVALMENWNNGDNDSFQANLNTINSSSGALQEQADIYAESWEAASKRVEAAAQGIYQDLLDDDFFITILNGFEDILSTIDNVIGSMGGLKGVATTIGTILLRVFGKDLAQGIENFGYNIKVNLGMAQEEVARLKKEAATAMSNFGRDLDTQEGYSTQNAYQIQGQLQNEFLENASKMNEYEKAIAQSMMDGVVALGEQAIAQGKVADQAEATLETLKEQYIITNNLTDKNNAKKLGNFNIFTEQLKTIGQVETASQNLGKTLKTTLKQVKDEGESTSVSLSSSFKNALQRLSTEILIDNGFDTFEVDGKNAINTINGFLDKLSANADGTFEGTKEDLEQLQVFLENLFNTIESKKVNVVQGFIPAEATEEAKKNILALATAATGAGKNLEFAKEKSDQVVDSGLRVGNSFKQASGHTIKFSEGIVKVADTLGSVTMVINTFKGVMDTIQDPDMSGWEKFLSIMGSVSTTIPMVATSFSNLIPLFKQGASGAQAVAKGASAVGSAGGTAATGIKAIGVAIKGMMGPVGWTIIALTAVAAAIAGIAIAANNAYNADANAAKEATKRAQELAEAHEEVKQRVDAVYGAFDNYDRAVEALNACTKGTEEWRDALDQVNQSALDLLNTYPELLKEANLFERDSNGMLAIVPEVREQIEQQLAQQERKAQAASLFGQVEVSEKNVQSQKTNLSRMITPVFLGSRTTNDNQVETAAIDASKILADNALELANLTEEEYRIKVQELLINSTDQWVRSSELFDERINALVDECVKYQSEVNSLAKNTRDASQEMINASAILVDEGLGDNYSTDIKNFVSRQLGLEEERIETETLKLIKGFDQTGANYNNDMAVKALWDRFNRANGTNLIAADNTIRGGKNNREIAYIDPETKEVKTYNAEYVASIIAAGEALDNLEGMAQKAAEVLGSIRNRYGEGVTEAVSNFISTGSFNSANQQELEELNGIRELRDLFPGLDPEQIAGLFQVDTYEEAVVKFNQGIKDSQEALNTAGDNLTKTTKKIYDDLISDGEMNQLSSNDRQTFSKYLNEAFVNAGSDGAKIFADAFEKVASEEEEGFIDAISSIDWNTADVDSLRQTLQECGVATIYTDGELQQLIDTMNSVESMTVESAIENYNKLHSIVNGLQLGDTISKDQYAEMAKLGLEDYFTYMMDGTYQLVGDAKELYDIVNKNSIDSITDVLDQLTEQGNLFQKFIDDPDRMSNNVYQDALDFTSLMGADKFGFDENKFVEWQEEYEQNGFLSKASWDELSSGIDTWIEAVGGAEGALKQLIEASDENDASLKQLQEAYASTANNIFELDQITQSFGENSEEVYQKFFDTISSADLSNLEMAIETLIEGGELSPELSNYLSQLEEQWPELADAARQGSDAYIESLQLIEEEIAELRIDKLIDKQQEIEIDINGDPTELQNALDDFTNNDYQIDVEIKAQLDRELDNSLNKLTQIKNMASKIGDDYLVAAEDIRSLASVFPDILSGATTTAEGMIQLRADMVQSAIETAKAEAETSAQSAAASLRAQAELFRQKAEIYSRMAVAARTLASEETISDQEAADARGVIANGLTELKQLEGEQQVQISNETTLAETENANQVDAAIDQVMNNATTNMQKGYQSMAQSSGQSAEIQIHNANAIDAALSSATDGVPGITRIPIKYGGSVGKSYTSNTVNYQATEQEGPAPAQEDSLDDFIDDPTTDWESKAEEYEGRVKNLIELAAQAEAGALQVEAAGKDVITTTNNVSAGLGADGEDDDAKGGGGGSGKKDEEEKAERLEDELDVYADIDAQIEEINNKLEAQRKITEHSEGEEKLASLKKEKELLDQLNGKYQEKLDLAKRTLAEQKRLLMEKAPGLEFSGDTILNQVETLQGYKEQINALADMIDNETDAAAKAALQAQQADLMEQYEIILDLLEQYKETLALLREIEGTITDNNYDSQGKLTTDEGGLPDGDAQQALEDIQKENYERLTKQLEIDLSFDENQLKLIEQYLEQIADDFYQMGEAAALTASKVGNLTGKLSSYESFYNSLQGANISQEDLISGMQESADGIMATLDELIALDKEMMNFYSDTLDAAADELGYFTDQLSHHTEVLDHYRSIVELINGEFDYESIGIILQGATVTTKNEMDAAMANYQMLLSEKAALEASVAMAPDEAARELYEKELRAITEACVEAESEMLDKTEAWAQAMKAVLENTMAEAAHEMEMALTNGMTFDALNSSLDRLSSYADEYLTKTNQIYETQKLINTAQQAIDKTTNNAAKARLKSYQDEINALQQKNQLSQLELEIAQAQYDVLLAEIALEEAQNAKATVRLQRDSEGNYGYVYTADSEQVSKAEQDLLDAQNALYNIGLEGANDYGQKMIELKEQLANDLIDLEERRAQGEFETLEAYEAERDRILQEYYALYTAYSEQYTTALGVDASIQEEAWVNAYENMITTTDEWKTAVTEYTEECEQAYTEWKQTVQTESEIIDSVLNHTEQEVKDVTNASNELKNKVVNEVIPAIQNELQQVRAATSAYANQRAAIQQLISYYQQLAQAIYAAVAAQNAMAMASSSASSSSPSTSGGGGSSSSTGDANYAALMYEAYQAGKMDEYEYYKNLRKQKVASTGNDYGVSTDRLDDYITSGGTPDSGGWFTDEWLKKNGSFGTGGYTGAWGPEGRLALVHEKELMLNPDDTVNFLDAINVVRNIAKTIDLEALRNQYSIMPVSPIYETQGIGETLQQQVQIEANFPNVSDRTEIEEAFNNLINTASQFANRKKL